LCPDPARREQGETGDEHWEKEQILTGSFHWLHVMV
jgi:hypothetical protein